MGNLASLIPPCQKDYSNKPYKLQDENNQFSGNIVPALGHVNFQFVINANHYNDEYAHQESHTQTYFSFCQMKSLIVKTHVS